MTHHFTSTLLSSMELEFEKCYLPYMHRRRSDTGLGYEPEGPSGTMVRKGVDAKGVETERKDTLPFLKDISKKSRRSFVRLGSDQGSCAFRPNGHPRP